MPGPLSAPNGESRLTTDADLRRDLEAKKKLDTGKTAKKHSKQNKK